MALPTERVVTGTYVNPVTGDPYPGTSGENYVIFEPIPARWTDQDGNQILLGGGRVNLDINGHFSEDVVCTDATGVLPVEGRAWRLRQFVGGSWSDPQIFVVPVGDDSLDISDALSVDICGVDYVPVPGPTGPAGSSAYQVAVDNGFVGTEAQWLASLDGEQGEDGDSAYEVAVENGFTGTEEEWLESLVGPQGPSGSDSGLDTGILSGGDISPNLANPLAIDINPLRGRILDFLVDPPTVTEVVTTDVTTVELDSVAQERAVTWFLMDEDGVYQQEARPSPEERRQFLVLGFVVQESGSIFLAQSIPTVVEQPVNQLYDLLDSLGAFNITGNDISPNGANLLLNHTPGTVFSRGWNHFDGATETDNPHIVSTVGASPAAWVHVLRADDIAPSSAVTTVDVGHYDNEGTLTAVGGGADSSVLHQLWIFPTNDGSEIHVLQYGQTVFDTLDAAVSAIGTTSTEANPTLPGNAILIGYLAVQGAATDLSDAAQARIVKAGKFGEGPGGGSADFSGYAKLSGAQFTGTISSTLNDVNDAALSSRGPVDTFDRFRRLADGEMQWGDGTAPLDSVMRRLSEGVLAFLGTDFLVGQDGAKSFRFRQSGSALDFDGAGADLFASVYELADFQGAQHTYLRLESGTFLAHASGVWAFGEGPFGGANHTIDGLNNELGFFAADPVGQQTVSGARSTGGALTSLLLAVQALGLIEDTTTAGPAVVETVNAQEGPTVVLDADDVGAIDASLKGVANGVAELGADGLVPEDQLPDPAVSSVNGETGTVVLDSADVGAIPLTQKGANGGVATLGMDGKVPGAQLPTAPVISVNGETGTVVLSAADVGALDEATADDRYVQQDSLWFNAKEHGAAADGTTDDATLINSLLSTSPAGSTVILPPGIYATGVPLVVPPGKTLRGLRANLMQVTDLYDPPVRIRPLSSFSGVAAIRFLNATEGGYADISGEQRVLDIVLDGSELSAGVDGIQAKGNVQNIALRDVTIKSFPGSGIYCGLVGGIAPYSWRMHRVVLDSNQAHGMFGERMVDLTAVDCQAIGNSANGWMLQNSANSQMIGCRAEWNGNHGFYLSGDWGDGTGSGGMLLSGCSTDRNGFNGVYLDCTGTPPILISGLMTRRDGRNGGTGGGGYAGLAVNAATTPLLISDWSNFPGVDDDGSSVNSPQFAGSFTGAEHVQIDNSYLHAATTALNDGGGNTTLRIGGDVVYAVGTTDAFTRNVAPSQDIIVAASDSRSRSNANFFCTGTDDHLVIQAAINLADAAPGKGRVRLLDGTFVLGATIDWPSGEGLGLTGSGWGTVIKVGDDMDDMAITFSGDETRSTFSDFTIDGNLAEQTTGPSGGIWAPGAVECVFQRIHFTSCASSGLMLGPMTGGAFGHNNNVLHCLFDNATTSTLEGNAIFLTSSDENFIVSCDFQFLGGSGPVMGMIHDTAGTQAILGCNFVNGANSRPAIRVQDSAATKISACNFDGVGGDAVFLAATNCVVEGNTIFGVGAIGTAGANSGIHLEYAATGNLIANNSISSHTVNGSGRSLIREESIGDSGNNLVVGNMLITKGTLSVAALDLNAPGTVARSNFGGGATGDPVLTTSMRGAASGVASLDSGTLVPVAQIPSLPASQITTGTFGAARIPDLSATYVAVTQKGVASGVATLDGSILIPVAQIPSLPAAQITSGTFGAARIPDLSATYIATTQKAAASGVASLDSGTLVPVAQIPALPASQITSGTFGAARIPDLSATYTPQSLYGNVWTPNDHGLIAWSFDPAVCGSGGTQISAGYIYLIEVVLRQAATIAKSNLVVGTAGATLTSAQNFVGLYDSTGTRRALSADMSTTWNSVGSKTANYTASYSAAAGRYYVALLFNGTTSPFIACGSTMGSTLTPGNANLSASSYRFCRSPANGNTSLPSSVTLSGYTPDANNIYSAVG